MIFKASKRSGGRQLGVHLLKTQENEQVEIHEVSGFISDTVMGAMNEAYAAARGTKCQRYLFSMSLSPPAQESVRVEVFEKLSDSCDCSLCSHAQKGNTNDSNDTERHQRHKTTTPQFLSARGLKPTPFDRA